ncbi:uncharacterized protein LOC135347807 [Halichondria panicea]|uniref:uncharacterized protein LOC135347807 n=1 Tax=Halichondria panicea TaxID=6063 RepID=UPI00312B6884
MHERKIILLVSLFLVIASCSQRYCVCETCNQTCNENLHCNRCHPLMWFVEHTQVIQNNSVITFLPGNHSLDSTSGRNNAVLKFSRKNGLNLTGNNTVDADASTVVCKGNRTGLHFQLSTNIQIKRLRFINCGFSLANTSALSFINSTNISVSYVSITHSCTKVEGALLWFDSQQLSITKPSNLLIAHSIFSFQKCKQNGKGLYLRIQIPKMNVTLHNVTVMNGAAEHGGNIEICLQRFIDNPSRVDITDSTILSGKAKHGGGIYLTFEKHNEEYIQHENRTFVTFSNTTFEGNYATKSGGALRLMANGFTIQTSLYFYNCTFKGNTAKIGGALLIPSLRIPTHLPHTSPQLSVIFDNCTISENNLIQYTDQYNGDGIVCLYSVDKAVIRNTHFTNNNGTALLLVESTVLFKNYTLFNHNVAAHGGAIRVCDGSTFFLYDGTHIEFDSNNATVSGGAIYAEDNCVQLTLICFYQVNSTDIKLNNTAITLKFTDNYASFAGDAIYGGSVDTCFSFENAYTPSNRQHYKALYEYIFHILPWSDSMVTSDPFRVCNCDRQTRLPNCTSTDLELSAKYPGERFQVNVAAIGQRNGTVPALVHITPTNLVHTYNNQIPVMDKCQSLTLAVFSKPNTTTRINISLAEMDIATDLSSNSGLKISIPIASCPWIFEFNETGGKFCDCHNILTSLSGSTPISCNITSMSITKADGHSMWINCKMDTDNNNTIEGHLKCSTIEIAKHCRYCNGIVFTPFNLSDQCIDGREGRLCGSCKANYSFSLGSPKCLLTLENCSVWRTLVLLIIFFAVGLLFFCILALLNITVAEGTINSLLVYTTCIYANGDIFFQDSFSRFNQILKVAINWFNLDLGFTVCFYSGMTAYSKQWLEFTFLIYLLLLGVMIVCMSRKFMWFTRRTGRNIVPVLSTMVLFSFSKIVKNCIKNFHCSRNHYKSTNNESPFIWLGDETIDCFAGSHIPLFLISVFLSVAALLYTFSLVLIQCLQRRSNWYALRWVNKLRPFFDANTGPCRDSYRFWPGFLLLQRLGMMLYSINLFNDSPEHKMLYITAVCILSLFLIFVIPRGVYKKWPLNVLEVWLFFLMASTCALMATDITSHVKENCINLSISSALTTFLLILIYHFYKQINNTKIWRKITAKICKKRKKHSALKNKVNESTPLIRPEGMPEDIHFNESREPLLED